VLVYTVPLYTGVPIAGIRRARFLFATAVLAVGLVTLVAVLAATVILGDIGVDGFATNIPLALGLTGSMVVRVFYYSLILS
jgi:hypothetical protein